MKKLKTEELSKLSNADLVKRLDDLRSELSKLRTGVARGTLKKERGEIKSYRRNIARILTAINAGQSKEIQSEPAAEAEESEGGTE
jgi:large subunit ribosomal protein L29